MKEWNDMATAAERKLLFDSPLNCMHFVVRYIYNIPTPTHTNAKHTHHTETPHSCHAVYRKMCEQTSI